MTAAANYRLLDFGNGRKLEQLGDYVIDRPCPAAVPTRPHRAAWPSAAACFDAKAKSWHFQRPWPSNLRVDCGRFAMPAKPTPYGHIGLFPEQQPNWRWLAEQAERLRGTEPQSPPPHGLNLFGYTGASSLAMAGAGVQVLHVDAAKPNVSAGRAAAEAAGLRSAIRWFVDDARKVVPRQQRRGQQFDLMVLDPPAYGHGPRGKSWRIERDLWPLLEGCLQLLKDPAALLVTGHSPEVDQHAVRDWLRRSCKPPRHLQAHRSKLHDTAGRPLDCGYTVRATW